MNWNEHSRIKGQHAYLGGSNYHWLNYDEDKLRIVYSNLFAKEKGTKLHDIASQLIKLHLPLPNKKKTLNMFVNDAIALKMQSELPLYYSPNAFGTADAISFEDGYLRIHDLKTGKTPAKFEQLRVYAALFCLEYGYSPKNITIIASIYQNDDVRTETLSTAEVEDAMGKIIKYDIILNEMKESDNGIE